MKPFYSIKELAEISGEAIHIVASALISAGVIPMHCGRPADFSNWDYLSHAAGGRLWVRSGRVIDPNPSDVIVSYEQLPDTWKHKLDFRSTPRGGDSLTPIIWGICNQIYSDTKKVTPRPVMAELRKLIGANTVIRGDTAGGIKYETDNGDEKELTSEQLRGRINEWRKTVG